MSPLQDDEEYQGRTRDRAKKRERTRSRVKTGKSLPDNALQAVVIQSVGPAWIVQVAGGEPLAPSYVVATVSGTVDREEADTIVTVGDLVWVAGDTIIKVEPRTTVLSRKAAGRQQKEQVLVANVDQLAIVMSAREPTYNKRLIDRYLIAADKGDLSPLIIINKMDLLAEDEAAEVRDDFYTYWHDLKTPVFFVTVSPSGLVGDTSSLLAALHDKRTLLAGPSGVGKSSIINTLSNAGQEVGEISTMFLKGKHTTTSARLIPLEGGGELVDSPGIREFAIWELDLDELPYYFEEFEPFMHTCKYTPCTHTHEPDCAVKDALEEGKIDPERYLSYLMLREQLT